MVEIPAGWTQIPLQGDTPFQLETGLANTQLAQATASKGQTEAAQAAALAPIQTQLAQNELANSNAQQPVTQLALKAKQQTLEDSMIADAATKAMASDNPNESWKELMGDLADKGVTRATQLAGAGYSDRLARTVQSFADGGSTGLPKTQLGSGAEGGGGLADSTMLDPMIDRMVANVPPAQQTPLLQQKLQTLDQMRQAFAEVRAAPDPIAAFDKHAAQFSASLGIPNQAGRFAGNHAGLEQWLNQEEPQIAQFEGAIQNRLERGALGLPQPVQPQQTKEVGNILYGLNPKTGTWDPLTPPPNKFMPTAGTDANGNPIILNTATGQTSPGTPGGAPANSLASYADKLMGSENATGNPAAQNPRSSAAGNGQFLDGTWLNMIKANRPDLAEGKTKEQILAMRSDPALSAEMTVDYARNNAPILHAAGIASTPATLAMAHKLGPADAIKVLNTVASPGGYAVPLPSILSSAVIKANPQLAGQTAGRYAQSLMHTFGDDPIEVSAQQGGSPAGTGVTGQDFLKTLDPRTASLVQALSEGRMAFPTGFPLTKPYWQRMMQNVGQYDPTFDAANAPSRFKTRGAFTSGAPAAQVTSLNTSLGHLEQLDSAIDRLKNTNYPWFNAAAQAAGQALGNTDTQAAIKNFNTVRGAVASELVKSLRGSGGAEADIQYWQKLLDPADGPVALHQAVQKAAGLLSSRVDALQDQYNTGMGTVATTVPGLSPHSRASLNRLSGAPLSPQEAAALPIGTRFIGQDGVERVRKPPPAH